MTATKNKMLKYRVELLECRLDGYCPEHGEIIAKFASLGDATAFAIARAYQPFPHGKVWVFEVYKGTKREYRAG